MSSCNCEEISTPFNLVDIVAVNSFTKVLTIVGVLAIVMQVIINDAILNEPSFWWYTLTRLLVSFFILLLVIIIVGCATTRRACPFIGALFIAFLLLGMMAWIIQLSTSIYYNNSNTQMKFD